MRKRRQSATAVEGLRLAIDCLPVETREAMLRGVRNYDRIIVGAYTDEYGGVCPMLAAHRCGGRTKFLSFAKSWDRFARSGARNKRMATPREVGILIGQLEASLASMSGLELDRAISEHHALAARTKRRELGERHGAERGGITPRRAADCGAQVDPRSGRELAAEADPRGEIRAWRLRIPLRGLVERRSAEREEEERDAERSGERSDRRLRSPRPLART
jgi:hypothetical protein